MRLSSIKKVDQKGVIKLTGQMLIIRGSPNLTHGSTELFVEADVFLPPLHNAFFINLWFDLILKLIIEDSTDYWESF